MTMSTVQKELDVQKEHAACHPAFRFKGSQRIDSLGVTIEEYEHIKTGALHYHIDSNNDENVFLVAFRTVPMDSTGVAHILEHTALCGSDKFPVRDPFFMMIRRSLNTFMNAFTSSDWTAYPFASKNKKDFNNLMDVYLDAVFFTRLDELDFLQEGHRVEFSNPDNPESELEFKGVVFNEMKGAMSSPVSVLWQTVSKYLYPTTTYHYNSGGEPADIPDLKYSQLKHFHKTHYHPGNAVFMTFGDIPAAEHQKKFEEQALSKFSRYDAHISVEPEKRYLAPISVEESYAFDASAEGGIDKQTHHVLGWLLGPCTSLDEVMRSNLLSHVLLDNSSSPLRRALETTELGTSPSQLCGLEDSNFEMCFLCGIEGSEPDKAVEFEKLVISVLEGVVANGIPHEQLESVLHQLEISQREIGGDGYPYGLQLILGGLTAAVHRSDPAALLNLDPVIDSLRNEIKNPEFIKTLVREQLLENPHRVRLTLRPDTELSARKENAEHLRLAKMKSAMSDDEKATIIRRAAQLAQRQQQVDDPDILPKVDLEDVPPELFIPESKPVNIAGVESKLYAQGTNGLVYQEVVQVLPELSNDHLCLLPYYSSCLTELGCGDKDYLKVQEWQSSVSGGVSGHASILARTDDVQQAGGYYFFAGKALDRNNKKLAELMYETLHTVRFDEYERIKDVISQKRSRKEQSVTGNGHTLAMMAASSGMSSVARLSHSTHGLEGIRSLKKLDDANKKSMDSVKALASNLGALHERLIMAPRQYMIVAEDEKLASLVGEFESVWGSTPGAESGGTLRLEKYQDQVRQMWVTNTQVNFCARAYPTVPMEHEDAAVLSVLGGFLRNGFLHTAIREKGGAYGGGASHDSNIAAFRFYSYRDPRLVETLDDFDRSIDWMLNGKHQWRQVEEAILGVIGTMDKPGSPAGEAKHAFHNELHGRTREKLQAHRQRVLAVTLEDLRRITEKYLRPELASTAVITSAATMKHVGDLGLNVIEL